jgi:hypothetical protein
MSIDEGCLTPEEIRQAIRQAQRPAAAFSTRPDMNVSKDIARTFSTVRRAIAVLLLCVAQQTFAQDSSQQLSKPRNQSSQRYEINQTFDGQVYNKDNNVWVYTKEFADLFGMPQQYIEDVQGIAAAAFRIEDRSYQECGFGGQADVCRKIEQCLIDLYFDERKNPLPWITDIKSQWKPSYSSMIWLRPLDIRSERPYGTLAIDPPPGVIRNIGGNSALIPFADPISKVEAIFTSNVFDAPGDTEAVSGSMYLLGYMHDFYKQLSVVSLQFGCGTFSRKSINIRLDSKRKGAYETPVARFNKVVLPEGFVQRIKNIQKARSDRNAVFYRSLFPPPLGTKGTQNSNTPNLLLDDSM